MLLRTYQSSAISFRFKIAYINPPSRGFDMQKSQSNTSPNLYWTIGDSEYSRALRLPFPDEEFFFSDRGRPRLSRLFVCPEEVSSVDQHFAWLAAWIFGKHDLILLT